MYYHLTNNKIDKIKNVKQPKKFFKPLGLWYAKNDDWEKYSADFKSKYNYKYKISVCYTTLDNPDKNCVLLITNNKTFNLFLQQYSKLVEKEISTLILTDWIKVAKVYGGIEIRNLEKLKINKKTREFFNFVKDEGGFDIVSDTHFFDIDSGCVWNKNAVMKFSFVD